MHSHALPMRHLHRQDLMIEAERERLVRQLVVPTANLERGFTLHPPRVPDHLKTFAQAVGFRLLRRSLA